MQGRVSKTKPGTPKVFHPHARRNAGIAAKGTQGEMAASAFCRHSPLPPPQNTCAPTPTTSMPRTVTTTGDTHQLALIFRGVYTNVARLIF